MTAVDALLLAAPVGALLTVAVVWAAADWVAAVVRARRDTEPMRRRQAMERALSSHARPGGAR